MTPRGKNLIPGSRPAPALTVGAGLVRGLMRLAVSKGASQQQLSERSGIDPGDLEDLDNRIPFPKYVALMRAGKELAADPALALHYGETRDIAELSIVGLIANACETMGEAFVQFNRYGRLVIEFDGPKNRFQLARERGGLWIVDTRENANEFPELTESTFANLVSGPRQFGVMQFAKEVHVTHVAPAYRGEYERIFGVPVIFGSDRNALKIDESLTSHRIARQPRYAFGILSARAEALLKSLEQSKTMRGHVESILIPVLHTGNTSINATAAKMGMGRTTLFRKLKNEGTTFEKVLDELRHRMALHYLSGKKVSVNETAYLVGFSEPAAFSRAFKRWTGKSPRDVRRS